MPTTPTLKLKTLVDFVLQANRIDDTALVRQIQSSLAKTKLPKLSITPVFDIDDKAFQKAFKKKGVLEQLDSQVDAIEKRMDKFSDTVRAQAKASAEALGVELGGDTEKGKQAQKRVDALVRQGTQQLASQRQVLQQARVAERALQEFYQTTAGKQLPETLKTIQKLQSGAILKKDLDAATVANVRKTTAFLEERASQLGAIEKAAIKLEKKVRGPLVEDLETGASGRPLIPGVPVYVPELRNQAKDYARAARDINQALEGQKAGQYQRALEGVKSTLDQASKSSAGLQRELNKLPKDLPFVKSFQEQKDAAKAGLDDLRKEFKKAQKIDEFGPRSEAVNRLYSNLEKKERGIAKLRSDLGAEVSRQRELELGRYLRDFREVTRSSVAQQEAEAGRRLLKGTQLQPSAVLPKITEPQQGAAVMEELKRQIAATTDKMSQYSAASRAAGTATNEAFEAERARMVQLQRLYSDVQRRTGEVFRSGTAQGQTEAAEQLRKQDVDYARQTKSLAGLNDELTNLQRNVAKSRLQDLDFDEASKNIDSLDKRTQALGRTLAAIGTETDLGRRGTLFKAARADLGLLETDVKRFAKTTKAQVKDAAAQYDKSFAAARLAAGREVLRGLGPELDFGQLNDVTKLSNAVEALREQSRLATEEAKRYANTVNNGTEENKKRIEALQRASAAYDTQSQDAQRRLNQVATGETQKGIAKLTKDIDTFGNRAVKSLDSAGTSLTGFTKKLKTLVDHNAFGEMRDQAERLDARLAEMYQRRPSLIGGNTEEDLRRTQQFLKDAQSLQQAVADLAAVPQAAARSTALKEAQRLQEGVDADRLARERVQAGRREAYRIAREQRAAPGAPGHGIPPLVLAAQLAPMERQLDVMAAIRDEATRLAATEEDRLARAARGGAEAEERLRQKIQLQKQSAAEAERVLRERGEVEFPEQARPVVPLTDAQVAAAKQAYGIDLRELEDRQRGMTDLARKFEGEITNIERRRADLQKQLGPAGARANKEFQDLGSRLPVVKKELGLIRKETESFNRAAASIQKLTTPEEIQRVLASRAIEGRRLVDAAGGAAGLASSLRGIPRGDRSRLPLVRETLQQQLGATLAQMDQLAARAGGRTTKEFKASQIEANHLRKAITRVNTELVGYTKLTAQVGGLFRQFARYGIGYAALYQALAGVRALITGVTDLDSALVSIQAVTQTTDKQMRIIEGSIKRVAVQTKFTTNEIAQAGQVLAQAGVLPEAFPQALAATAQFAAATESSMEISADLLSTMRNIFTELSDLDIANQLTRAVNISKLTAADLKTIFSLSGQVAKGYNLASEQYLGAVTTLRNAGIKASTVATGLRQALIEVFAPDTKSLKLLSSRYAQLGETRSPESISQRFFEFSQAKDPALEVLRELRRLGFTSTGKATFAGRTFDVRAENVIKGLINRLDEYVSSQAQIVFGNAAVTASQQQMEALNASMSNLGAAISATAHSLSQDLLPSVENFIDGITDAVQRLGEFDANLRATTGSSALSAVGSGGLALALSAATTPVGLGFGKATLRNVGALGVGTFVGGQAQEVAGEKGFGSGAAKLIGDLSALLATFVLFMGPQLKKLGGFLKSSAGSITKTVLRAALISKGTRATAKALTSAKVDFDDITSLKKGLGLLPRLMGALSKLFSFSGIGAVIALATGAYALLKRYTGTSEFKDAQNKLRQAEQNSRNADAVQQQLAEQLETLQPTRPGFVAGGESIAGSTEELTRNITDVRDGIGRFFDKAGEDSDEVLRLLRELERTGFAEGSPIRARLQGQIQAFTSVDLSGDDNAAREELTRLQAALARVDNQAAGLLKNARENYSRFADNREKYRGTIEGAFYEQLEQAAEDAGQAGVLSGVLEATSFSVAELFNIWINNFGDIKDTIEEVQKANEKAALAEKVRQQASLAAVQLARSQKQAEKLTREATTVATTERGFEKQRADVAVREARLAELQVLIAERGKQGVNFTESSLLPPAPGTRARQAEALVRDLQPLLDEFANLTVSLQVYNETINAGVAITEKALEARRAEVRRALETFQALEGEATTNRAIARELLRTAGAPSTAATDAEIRRILRETGGDTQLAAERLVTGERTPGGPTEIIESPGLAPVLRRYGDIYTNFEDKRGKEEDRPLTYLETEEAVERQRLLGLLELEIRKKERAQQFGDLEGLLADRRKTLVDQIEGEIAFERAQPEPATERARVTRQNKINQLNLRLLNAEFQYENDVNEAHRKEIAVREKQLNQHLKHLKVLSEAKVTTGGFTDFQGLEVLEEQYRDGLRKLIKTIEERARVQGLPPEEAAALVEAARTGATSLRAFAEIYAKIIAASRRYLQALSIVAAPEATTPTTDLDTEIVRRERGIRRSPQQRLRSLEVRTNAARESLSTRKEARDVAQARYVASVEAGAAPDVIQQNLEQLAQAESGVQDLIDQIVELRRETAAVSLDIGSELRKAFDPQGIFGEFRERAEEDIFTLADDIRTAFGDVFDDVAGDFADALFDNDDEQSLRDRLRNTFDDFFKDLGKRVAEAYFKQAVVGAIELVAPGATAPKENGNSNPLFEALGIGGRTKGQYETVEIDGKTVIVNGLVAGLPQSGVPGEPGFVGPLPEFQIPLRPEATSGVPAAPGVEDSLLFKSPFPEAPKAPEVAIPLRPEVAKEEEEAEEAATGFFTTVKDGFTGAIGAVGAGFQKLGGSIAGLFGKIFGGGEGTQRGVSAGLQIGSVLAAKDGAVLKAGRGMASLRVRRPLQRADGGMIRGPGTETSDSIPGLIVDDKGRVQSGLLVSNKESILNAKATAALGEDTINYLNANAKRFANGGLVSGSQDLQAVSSSLTRSTRQRAVPEAAGGADVDNLAEALIASMESSEPRTMSLQVDDSSLNRTLRDYLEGYFADVVAGR